jgi:hypothetical protein
MELKSGTRLRSQVDATEIIVVRSPAGGIELGKRYTDGEARFEVLVTKPGTNSLAANGVPLVLKEAKPLPASD